MSDTNDENGKKKRVQPPAIIFNGDEIPRPLRALLESIQDRMPSPRIDDRAPTDDRAATLRSLKAMLDTPSNLAVGDIVRHKPGLGNSRIGGMAIVTRVYDEADAKTGDTTDHSSPYYYERLDTVIGVLVNDGIFFEYHVDGRRFEKVPDDELEQ